MNILEAAGWVNAFMTVLGIVFIVGTMGMFIVALTTALDIIYHEAPRSWWWFVALTLAGGIYGALHLHLFL